MSINCDFKGFQIAAVACNPVAKTVANMVATLRAGLLLGLLTLAAGSQDGLGKGLGKGLDLGLLGKGGKGKAAWAPSVKRLPSLGKLGKGSFPPTPSDYAPGQCMGAYGLCAGQWPLAQSAAGRGAGAAAPSVTTCHALVNSAGGRGDRAGPRATPLQEAKHCGMTA